MGDSQHPSQSVAFGPAQYQGLGSGTPAASESCSTVCAKFPHSLFMGTMKQQITIGGRLPSCRVALQ